MNIRPTPLFVLFAPLAIVAQPQQYDPPTAGETPPVQIAPMRQDSLAQLDPQRSVTGQVTLADNQRLYAPAGTLVSAEQANAVLAKFKGAYEKLGKPRLLIYVNRELVDDSPNLKLVKRVEQTDSSRTQTKSDREPPAGAAAQVPAQVTVNVGGSGDAAMRPADVPPGRGTTESTTERVTASNTYEAKDAKTATLSDRQTVRDIERLFGRPLRLGGATVADQKVSATLLADKPVSQFMAADNDQARKDREALAKTVDVVVEVLISTRQITVAEVSGDRTYAVPDMSATAIRLSDSAVLGQASARDVLGKDREAGRIVRQFDINDIVEATALALMEDMANGTK